MSANTPANAVQVGGTHYKTKAIQPWDYIARNGIGYLEGCAIKYLSRWQDKGGLADLQKARHYIDKLIELEEDQLAKNSAIKSDSTPRPADGR
jgi:hypothetical protein